MANYYEVLGVQPRAAVAEIEGAWSELYNQWRRLVTHHDPNTVNQANQALATLDQIRGTLLDPGKRSVYDAAIGLNGPVAGLVDLAALGQVPVAGPTPPPPRPAPTAATARPAAVASSLWTCPKAGCGTDNPPNTQFCFRCGTQLVRGCPECGRTTSLIATSFCGACGFKYDVATQRKQLRDEMQAGDSEFSRLNREIENLQMSRAAIKMDGMKHFIWAVLTVGISLIVTLFMHMDKQSQRSALDTQIQNVSQQADVARSRLKELREHYDLLAARRGG